MKVSELWLREWVNPSLTVQEIARQLTMAGLEIDTVSPVAGTFDKVIVAEVINTKVHPQADRLTLCEVNMGENAYLQVVCGAANVRKGLKVALAMIGANLPGGMTIKETTLRGELSQGMLCSFSELGMNDESEGIIELDQNAPIGQCLRQYLMLNDHVLDVELTPNRADCFSTLGIAREIAAWNAMPLMAIPNTLIIPDIDDIIPVKIVNPEACSRYCGRVIRGINSHATTPLWMAERLRRSGIRLIHPVVDVCNYVMLELGQPMHGFDLQTIKEGIVLRFAQNKEKLTLLDGQELSLKDNVLVVADKEKLLAMAGIMGGESTAVNADTTDIFLESAFFNPLTLAGVARHYGLCTDASQRFERGVDPALPMQALDRATTLLKTIVGGKVGPLIQVDAPSCLPSNKTVILNTNKVQKLTGISIAVTEMQLILERLGMVVTTSETEFSVQIPTYRFDIHADVDLVEEIIRMYGYDNIKASPAAGIVQAGQINVHERLMPTLSAWFSNRGYHETISYSFVDPELQEALYPEAQTMQLLNPISSELAQMRVGLWPGLIASMVHNLHRQHSTLQLFETGVIFEVTDNQLTERACVAGLVIGEKGGLNWSEKSSAFDFYDIKGDLEALFKTLKHQDFSFIEAQHPALHPGQSAQVCIAGKAAGWLGVLHPRIADALDVKGEIILFELALDALINQERIRYQSISKYPQIRRDLSFLVDEKVNAASIENAVRQAITNGWLKTFDIFDVYMGKGVPEGQKSIAIALTLQNPDKTLVDAEINFEINAIIKVLIERFSITLRD
jgi:phenylalanyl-tRNA synthetase beta chain